MDGTNRNTPPPGAQASEKHPAPWHSPDFEYPGGPDAYLDADGKFIDFEDNDTRKRILHAVNSAAAEARALLERCRDLCDSPYRGEDFQRAMTLSADIKRFLAGAPPDAPT